MTDWRFHCPVRVEFGADCLDRLATLCAYQRMALVTTPGFTRRGLVARVAGALGDRLAYTFDGVKPNPDFPSVEAAVTALSAHAPDALVALGGGSAIDTAKAIARRTGLPVIAIPTTAGTGAEVTPFATVWDFDARKKHSIAGDDLYPVLALLDPSLTLGLPWAVTVASALDAVSHAFESTWNRHAGPISLALAARSLRLSLAALPRLAEDLSDGGARADMLQASTIAGIAIAQTRTALAHSISYPLTAHLGLDHGLACSFTLPEVLRFNAAEDDGRLTALAAALGHRTPAQLAEALDALFERVGLGALLGEREVTRAKLLALRGEMFTPERAGNNLRTADAEDITRIVERAAQALRL